MASIILDAGGHAVMMQRLDGTQLGSIEVAKDKAWSAVAFRRPTKAFEDAVSQGGANLRLLRLTGASPIEGGIPLISDGKIIGSIGVSGGTAPPGRAGGEGGGGRAEVGRALTLPSPTWERAGG